MYFKIINNRSTFSLIHFHCSTYTNFMVFPLIHLHPYIMSLFPSTAGCPDTGPQVVDTLEIQPESATITWQAAQTDDPLLAIGMRYAVYSRCETESSYQLVAENIEGLSYTLTDLPASSQCVLRVVAYHRYCLRNLDGVFKSESLPFTTTTAGKLANNIDGFEYSVECLPGLYIHAYHDMKIINSASFLG